MTLDRFMCKRAELASIFPAVAGPAVGGFAGRAIGARYHAPDLGAMIGAITGGTAGQLIKEKVEDTSPPTAVPAGAPYALDASMADIPPWALQGAQLLQPTLKQADEGLKDVVLGDALGPLYPLGQGIRRHDMGGALKGILGQGLGVAGGGLAGYGAGHLLNALAGRQVNVPGLNMPLSTLLSGLGATIGGVKGLNIVR